MTDAIPIRGRDCPVRAQEIERHVKKGPPQSRTEQAVQQMRNLLTVRITQIANGYTVTETGTGEIFFYETLQECYEHISGFYGRIARHP